MIGISAIFNHRMSFQKETVSIRKLISMFNVSEKKVDAYAKFDELISKCELNIIV